jgi:hypothetical protein
MLLTHDRTAGSAQITNQLKFTNNDCSKTTHGAESVFRADFKILYCTVTYPKIITRLSVYMPTLNKPDVGDYKKADRTKAMKIINLAGHFELMKLLLCESSSILA